MTLRVWQLCLGLLFLPCLFGCPAKQNQTTSVPKQADAKITFTEVTHEAGITWKHYSGARGKKYMPEGEMSGCAFLDYNGDAKPDILLLSGTDWRDFKDIRKRTFSALYRNEGNGKFTNATKAVGLQVEMHAMGVAVGDYNNDGWDDIYITCVDEPSRLFQNQGGKRFVDVTQVAGVGNKSHWGSSTAWLDYDRDGWLDLVVGNYVRWSPQTDIFCALDNKEKTYCTPLKYTGQPARLYRNLRNGKFEEVTQKANLRVPEGKTLGVVTLDFDDDGFEDIAFANDQEPNSLFRNRGDGTFEEVGLRAGFALPISGSPRAGMGIDAADIDGSGKPSLLVSNFSGEGVSLFQNQGGNFLDVSHPKGVHEASVALMGWGVSFLDYDLDGKMDIFILTGHLYHNIQKFHPDQTYAQPPLLFRNQDVRFENVSNKVGIDFQKPIVGRGSAYADYDADGDLDLLMLEMDGAPRLLRNEANKPNWVRARLIGTKSNRNGFGSKVIAKLPDGSLLTRWVKSSVGYLSCSEATLTFGLAQHSRIEKLSIRWASGQISELDGIQAGQTIVLTEPK